MEDEGIARGKSEIIRDKITRGRHRGRASFGFDRDYVGRSCRLFQSPKLRHLKLSKGLKTGLLTVRKRGKINVNSLHIAAPRMADAIFVIVHNYSIIRRIADVSGYAGGVLADIDRVACCIIMIAKVKGVLCTSGRDGFIDIQMSSSRRTPLITFSLCPWDNWIGLASTVYSPWYRDCPHLLPVSSPNLPVE